jgi:glycosyltransferase involved in cell wall biosynthesis
MNARPPKVSVVVPVYNAERTLDECLRSLLAQDFPEDDLEIIAVDNWSTDRTPAILREYSDRVRTVRRRKRGPAAARNRGIREARGEIVAMTDSDCVADPGWVRHVVAPLEDSAVALVGGRILSVRPCNTVEKFGEEIHDHEKAITVWKPAYVITMNWAARRSLLDTTGLFDEEFLRCEDVDLAYRIVRLGHTVAYAHDAVIYHRNERTYAGLFAEGFVHGVYSVQAIKKHDVFLSGFGHRNFDRRSYVAIATSFRDYVEGRDADRSLCSAVFNTGKKLGKVAGSVRFGYFDA